MVRKVKEHREKSKKEKQEKSNMPVKKKTTIFDIIKNMLPSKKDIKNDELIAEDENSTINTNMDNFSKRDLRQEESTGEEKLDATSKLDYIKLETTPTPTQSVFSLNGAEPEFEPEPEPEPEPEL